MFLASLTVSAAFALDPECAELHLEDFRAGLDQIDQAFLARQVAGARRGLSLAEKKIPCIAEVVPKEDLARFAIRYAYALAGDLDTPEAERWALLARTLDPTLPWPSYVPPDHEVRKLATGEPLKASTLDGVGLAFPEGGGVFLDGRFLTTPTAEPGVPHLLQVGDAMGYLVDARWQDGAAFPEERLGPVLDTPPLLPSWFGEDGKRPKKPHREHPWTDARLTNLERAGGFAAIGGSLFASALAARSAYDARPANGLYYATDGATVASAAAGATSLVFLAAAAFGR